MIKEKTFLRVFKKMCKELLKDAHSIKVVVEHLGRQECPFPKGCYLCLGCVSASPTTPSRDCHISKEWQNNVFYFQKKKDCIGGMELCEKMIKIINEEIMR